MNLPLNIQRQIEEFAKTCKLEKVVLFGSRARGTNRERSDIDLAVFGGGVSAYTEEPLSGDAHIDHFRKRDLFPNLTFDWNNLFVDV